MSHRPGMLCAYAAAALASAFVLIGRRDALPADPTGSVGPPTGRPESRAAAATRVPSAVGVTVRTAGSPARSRAPVPSPGDRVSVIRIPGLVGQYR